MGEGREDGLVMNMTDLYCRWILSESLTQPPIWCFLADGAAERFLVHARLLH